MMLIILESFQPNYNSALHYVSSLGVGETALIYNISIILFGTTVVISSSILAKLVGKKLYIVFLFIAGIFVIGVGVFPENIRPMHGIVTPFTFIFATLSALASFRSLNAPFSYISISIGLISVVTMTLFFNYVGLPAESTITFLGLAKGTIERIIIYPLTFWLISLSIYLNNNNANMDSYH